MKTIKNKLPLQLIVLWGLLRTCELTSLGYVVTTDQLIASEGDHETLIDFSHLEPIGRERLINGTFKILDDMDDENFDFTVHMYTSPNGDGNYKKMAMDLPDTKVCEGFKKFYTKFVQPSLTYGENSNIPYIGEDGLCPIPSGEYYVKNVEINTDLWPNQIPRGTLKIVVTFSKHKEAVGSLTGLFKIEDDTR